MSTFDAKQNLYSRFSDVIASDKKALPFVLFGCGSIGSYAGLALGKLGFPNVTLLDMDKVEDVNVGTQLFGSLAIGMNKTEATQAQIYSLADQTYHIKEQRFHYDEAKDFSELFGLCRGAVIICAIDSMKARDWLFTLAPKMGAKYFIDSRMAIEFLDIYGVDLKDEKAVSNYKKTLFSDEDAVPMPCTNKSIGYTAMVAGGIIGKLCKDAAVGKVKQPYLNFKMDINNLAGEIL